MSSIAFREGHGCLMLVATGFILGGSPLDDQSDTTAVRPLRSGLIASSASIQGLEKLIGLAPPEKAGGFCFNHYAESPIYIEHFWGEDHYKRLLATKKEVDPNHRFNVYQGVGYHDDVALSRDTSRSKLGCGRSVSS